MSTERDPLPDAHDPDRLAYQLGVMLDATDFRDEQTYHRGRLARALAYLHGSGTAAGLDAKVAGAPGGAEPEEVQVEAGLAVDGAGRLIEVPRRACIRLQRWFDAQSDGELALAAHGTSAVLADVFLRFAACPRGRTPAFAAGPFDALDATSPSRIRDGYELKLVLRTEETPPVPDDPWRDLRGVPADERGARVRQLIAGFWERAQVEDRLAPATLDRGLYWVFLARVRIPVAGGGGGARLHRTTAPATLETGVERPLVYSAGALVTLLGL